jgi:hypothetical protein
MDARWSSDADRLSGFALKMASHRPYRYSGRSVRLHYQVGHVLLAVTQIAN